MVEKKGKKTAPEVPVRKNEVFGAETARDQMQSSQGPLTFEVPVIEVPLPSNGTVYPEGHPLRGQSSIVINAMTAAQENILTNRSLAKRGTLLTYLIQSCVRDKAVNAKEMLIGDRNTVMVALRVSGYGAEYKASVSCPACGETTSQDFRLDQLSIRRLEIEPISEGNNLFEYILPMSGAKVRFKFLTGADEEELATISTQRKKLGPGVADSELVTTGLLSAIVSINGVERKDQIAMALPRMPAADSRALRRHIQDNEPGIQMRGWMECRSCDHTQEVDMPLGANFFWPDAE